MNSDDHSCIVHLELLGALSSDVSKLSLVPREPSSALTFRATDLLCDDHWSNRSTLNWMWKQAPAHIALDVEVMWNAPSSSTETASLDVVWEHVHGGERTTWTLGSVLLPGKLQDDDEPVGSRMGRKITEEKTDIRLRVDHAPAGAFVKWTEYIPEGCTCEVTEPSGASLRSAQNRQIFLWFEVDHGQDLMPKYQLTCLEPPQAAGFDGELEVAFGTRTISSDIAGVEWVGDELTLNENMELKPSPDAKSAASHVATVKQADSRGSLGVQFSVQLLANHRDLNASEVVAALGYSDSYHILRHEGWHKYLTDEVATYSEARDVRSHVWATTQATDAFVTASLAGERITVQEALLMSNQSWIP